MARHAQGRVARRRHRLLVDVVHDLPFLRIGERVEADPEARAADAHALVDARHVRAADHHGDARGAVLQRFGGVVDRRGAGADDPDHLAAQRIEIDVVDRVAHVALVEPAEHRRRVGAAEPVAPVRQHDAARRDFARACTRAQRQDDEFAVAAKIDQLGLVLDRHVDDAPVPAQIVHPLQARDAMDLLPCGEAELRLEPGAER